jgi:LPS sulfotransferase NodH
VREAGATPNGVFGSKLMWDQMEELVVRLRQLSGALSDRSLIERHFPSPSFIWIWREDVAAQAISWARAIQTGRWQHWDTGDSSGVVPVYDREQIEALTHKAAGSNSRWRAWFAANNIQPLVVRFEDLIADGVAVTRGVLGYIGLASGHTAVAELTIKSSDDVNAEWLDRFRSGE